MAAVLDQIRRLEMNAERDAKERQALSDFANLAKRTPSPYRGHSSAERAFEPNSSSPNQWRASHSPSPGTESKWKSSKAFKLLMDATKERYDGIDLVKYQIWKLALAEEVSTHIEDLSPTQWIELLQARTKGAARAAVDRAYRMILELRPQKTLEKAWEFLDQLFQTDQKPSQQILSGLVNGPTIRVKDATGLATFAQDCKSALCLADSIGLLPSLNEPTTMDSIINRLDTELFYKWCEYKADRLDSVGNVPFKNFVQWIDRRANLELGINSKKTPTSAMGGKSTNLSAGSSNTQGQNHATGPSGSNNVEYGWRNQRPSGTVPAGGISQTQKNQETFICVFCEEDGRYNIAHNTVKCHHLSGQKFSSEQKWDILYKRNVCLKCLGLGHTTYNCRENVTTCSSCRVTHASRLPCKSEQEPPRAYGGSKNTRGG